MIRLTVFNWNVEIYVFFIFWILFTFYSLFKKKNPIYSPIGVLAAETINTSLILGVDIKYLRQKLFVKKNDDIFLNKNQRHSNYL